MEKTIHRPKINMKDVNTAIIDRIKAGGAEGFHDLLKTNEGFVRYIAGRYYSLVVQINSIGLDDLI